VARNKPWLAFSVSFPSKHLDLVGRNQDDVARWFAGVQALAPLGGAYLSRGAQLWRRAALKVAYYAFWQQQGPGQGQGGRMDTQFFVDELLQAARDDILTRGKELPDEPILVDRLDMQIAAAGEDRQKK
jgi:hypothetical protein